MSTITTNLMHNISGPLINAIKNEDIHALAQYITPKNIENTYAGVVVVNAIHSYYSEHGTALHLTANSGSIKCLQWLLTQGANIEAQENNMWTPLHVACWRGHTDIAITLLKHGANIEAQDRWQKTPLHLACIKGYTDTALVLIKQGANINAKNNYGKTPIQLAKAALSKKKYTTFLQAIHNIQKDQSNYKQNNITLNAI